MEFTSLGTFADAMGTGVATDYMSVRTAAHGTRGWTTHAITPPQQPMSFNAATGAREPLYEGEFTPDLQGGVFLGSSPVTDAPNVANVANLYLRTDLRTAGAGSYQLISACPLCDLTSTPVPPMTPEVQPLPIQLVAGVSADLSHVLFESKLPLTVGTAGLATRLSEFDQGWYGS